MKLKEYYFGDTPITDSFYGDETADLVVDYWTPQPQEDVSDVAILGDN